MLNSVVFNFAGKSQILRFIYHKLDVQVYNTNGDAIKKQFKKQLALCGQGSIFKALFTRSETPPPIWNPKLLAYCGL